MKPHVAGVARGMGFAFHCLLFLAEPESVKSITDGVVSRLTAIGLHPLRCQHRHNKTSDGHRYKALQRRQSCASFISSTQYSGGQVDIPHSTPFNKNADYISTLDWHAILVSNLIGHPSQTISISHLLGTEL